MEKLGCFGLIFILALSFLGTAGAFWVICLACKAIGFVAIGGWTIAFSWKAAFAFWVICLMIELIFKGA